MSTPQTAFAGSISDYYDTYLRPLLFEPFALDLARRVEPKPAMRVLELACGTGIATRALLGVLPGDATLVATDASEEMLATAQARISPDIRLAFQHVDATTLPFDDGSFDLIVCQFGLMFFPDKPRALAEMRRVVSSAGQLLLSTWDALARNMVQRLTQETMERLFPDNTPRFYEVPCHMHDTQALEVLVRDAGFSDVRVEKVAATGHTPSVPDAAKGLVMGNPLKTEIRQRGASVDATVAALQAAFVGELGSGAANVPLNGIVVTARA